MRPFAPKTTFETRVLLLGLAGCLPGIAVAIGLLWMHESSPWLRWFLAVLLLGAAAMALAASFRQIVRPLRTISSLLAALREEDFSTRASGAQTGDALGEVYMEINTLSQLLQDQRLGALEATALLRTVMEEIDVAVFAFDEQRKLRLGNRAGQRLLAQPAERLMEQTADQLHLDHCLEGEPARTWTGSFPSGAGRWSMRRGVFRQGGRPHDLLVISDMSRALREEEREAWQRLVRVLGHEINNSLAPIKSIAGSLDRLIRREPLPEDWRTDATQGLGVIATRAEALGRFMAGYTHLARLPRPKLAPVDIGAWLRRVASLETRLQVAVQEGPPVTVLIDSDQVEQLMINLVRNATDAALDHVPQEPSPPQTAARVEVSWTRAGGRLRIQVQDNGPGLANTTNLFVPFFTTKPGGSGIGLALCRQIAEAHGGSVALQNREEGPGCVATVELPLSLPPAP